MLVNTCGFVEAAKKDSVDTLLAAADLKVDRPAAGGGGGRLPGRALRRGAGRGAARGRRRARLRRLRRCRRPAAARPGRRAHQSPTSRGTAARCCRWPPPTGRRPPTAPARSRGIARSRSGRRAPASGPPLLRRGWTAAVGAAEDRLRLRPALHLLRDPGLPRGLSSPARAPSRGRGALAGRAGRPRALAGQRELLLLRQGPRRPPAAGGAAGRAGGGRGPRVDPGLLPAAGRDAARA